MCNLNSANIRDIVREKVIMLRKDGILDDRDENECVDKTLDMLNHDENFMSILETYITSAAMWAG